MRQGRATMPHSGYRLWHHLSAPFGPLSRSISVPKPPSAKGSKSASGWTCPGQAQLSSGKKPYGVCFTIEPCMSLLALTSRDWILEQRVSVTSAAPLCVVLERFQLFLAICWFPVNVERD